LDTNLQNEGKQYLWCTQICRDSVEISENFVDERFGFARLLKDEVTSTFLSDLDERIARHVLYSWKMIHLSIDLAFKKGLRTFVQLMHKFKQLINDRLQEFPMRLEEARILSHDVHDIRGDNCFVVFASFHLS
jgi:hypothetical protein